MKNIFFSSYELGILYYLKVSNFLSIVCGPPPIITQGGTHNPYREVYFEDDDVIYNCFSGYVLVGESINICLISGEWSNPSPPECSRTGQNKKFDWLIAKKHLKRKLVLVFLHMKLY